MGDLPGGMFSHDSPCLIPDGRPTLHRSKPISLRSTPMFNRCKLGRTLDAVDTYGCDLFFSEIALVVCQQEALEQRFNHLATTSSISRAFGEAELDCPTSTLS